MTALLESTVNFFKSHPFISLSIAGVAYLLYRGGMEIFGAENVEQPKFTKVRSHLLRLFRPKSSLQTLINLTPVFQVYSPPGLDPSSPLYYEVRKYAPQIRASTTFLVPPGSRRPRDSNNGFMTIARYIFGGNTARSGQGNEKVAMTAPVLFEQGKGASEKIAMTAPVLMSSSAEGAGGGDVPMTMSFVMPSKYQSIEDLPIPKDPRVQLSEIPEHTVAVLRRSGSLSAALSVKMEKELRELVEKDGKYKLEEGRAVTGGYNPPCEFGLRVKRAELVADLIFLLV
jgi:hypothetical protein